MAKMGNAETFSDPEQPESLALLQVLLALAGHVVGQPCAALHRAAAPEPMVCLLQIDAASLIAASVMAAPCALAMSKLVYPEVEESKFKGKESVHIASG